MGRLNLESITILNEEMLDHDLSRLTLIDMSWSRFSTYLDCNAKYKHRYIEGHKEDTTIPLALGSAIHDTLEAIVKYNTKDDIEATGFYLTAIEKHKQELVLTAGEIEEGKRQVLNALIKMETITNGDIKKVKGIETGFRYVIGRGNFLGFIDLIVLDEDEQGTFINVIDYKTGKNKYKVKTHGQMKLYALAVKRLYPEARVKASLYWTRFGEIESYEFSDEELSEFKTETAQTVENIINDSTFSPNGAMFKCCYCNFANKEVCKKGFSNRIIMEKAKRKRELKKLNEVR